MITTSKVLAVLFLAAAAVLWIYSFWFACDLRAASFCANTELRDFGSLVSFAMVLALAFVGLTLWPAQDHSDDNA